MTSPNKTSPELSIIIVNYNTGDFLSGTLNALIAHPPSVNWEAIIFDNGSSDQSIESAKKSVGDDIHFRFIQSDENLGFAAGNNRAISQSSGKYILLLNPDTAVTDKALDSMLAYLKSNTSVGAVGVKLIDSNGDPTVSFGWFPTLSGILAGAFLPKRIQGTKSGGLGIAPEQSMIEPLEVDYVSGACLMTSAEIWSKVGPLDEGYFAYFEETDWCLRLKKLGFKAILLPSTIVYHFEGRSFTGIPYRKMEIFV
jgi:N-acetylglucosaminyl-diphospho-decaprenol L-rhamnosyltransferase